MRVKDFSIVQYFSTSLITVSYNKINDHKKIKVNHFNEINNTFTVPKLNHLHKITKTITG